MSFGFTFMNSSTFIKTSPGERGRLERVTNLMPSLKVHDKEVSPKDIQLTYYSGDLHAHLIEILFSPEKSPNHSTLQWGFKIYFPPWKIIPLSPHS